jgi:hypothetical protein
LSVGAVDRSDISEGSPVGPGIKAAVAYLHGCQMVSFKRLTELPVSHFVVDMQTFTDIQLLFSAQTADIMKYAVRRGAEQRRQEAH